MAASGYSAVVDRLITALGRLPGIGARSAERLAHHLLKCTPEEAIELADAIRATKEQIRHCQVCFHLTEAEQPMFLGRYAAALTRTASGEAAADRGVVRVTASDIIGCEGLPPILAAFQAEHPGIADAAVVGLPDERWGELVVAYVVATDPSVDAAACETHCTGHPMLASFKRPRAYRFIDQIPLTATGKKLPSGAGR